MKENMMELNLNELETANGGLEGMDHALGFGGGMAVGGVPGACVGAEIGMTTGMVGGAIYGGIVGASGLYKHASSLFQKIRSFF